MIKLDKIFGDKKNTSIIYLLLAMGILFMIFGSTNKPQSSSKEPAGMSRAHEAELILSEIKGAGEVRVMISEGSNASASLVSDEKSKKGNNGVSVLIVADGGSNSYVCEKIIKAASAALGVDSHKIQVFERKD